MSYSMFLFYFWFVFVWCAAGVIFIAVAVIRELVKQFKAASHKSHTSQVEQ